MRQHVFVAIACVTKVKTSTFHASIYHATHIAYDCATYIMHACVYSTHVYDCATYIMQDQEQDVLFTINICKIRIWTHAHTYTTYL